MTATTTTTDDEATRRQRRPARSDPLIGSVVGGRYVLVRLIGRGGMARVFEGRDEVLDRPIAIKVLDPRLAEDEALATRFRREARIACGVSHPNAVASYEHGESADGLQWLAMELCRGQPLSALLQAEGRLAASRAVRIVSQVLGALEAAHERGVVHRDVKLSNIMVDDSDDVRVLDFGLAKDIGVSLDACSVTAAGVAVGSPLVMSPEQCLGEACDARSDVYSAGVALYQLLSGRPPFESPDAHRLLWLHVTELPPPLRPACDVPEALEAAVLRALEKDADDRWPSARSFREAIEASLLPSPALAPGDRFRVQSRSGRRYAGRVAWIADGRLGVDLEDGRPATLVLARLDLATLELVLA